MAEKARLWQFIKLQFQPGINRDTTNYSAEGKWWDMDKMRFLSGFPQNIGGWAKASPTAIHGACRQLWNWITTYSDDFLSAATNSKVYIEAGGVYYDVTPLRATAPTMSTTDTDNCIYTTDTSTTVTVNLGAVHSAAEGSFVTIAAVTGDIGGVPDAEINANHKITYIDTDSFSFEVDTAATSTVAGGGGTAITIDFELAPGYANTTSGLGWGAGTYSRGAYGTGAASGINLEQTDWWLDNFDNDLVANIRNGAVYWWERGTTADPASALAARAVTLSSLATFYTFDPDAVPVKVMQTMVSQADKHLLALGAVPFGSTDTADFDPMLIRWADQDTPWDWTPGSLNTAGGRRVSRGSRIVRGLPTRQETLIWSDTHLYALQFLGTRSVFGLQEYAGNISIASPRACVTAGNAVYWMGMDKFYTYGGRVETLPCSVKSYVFDGMNTSQSHQVACGTNEAWNEVWWFYPSTNSSYNDRYVVYNYLEKIWVIGTFDRLAWYDTPLRNNPVATTFDETAETGYIYNHENGLDADGSAMTSYIQSNDFDVGEGDRFMLINRMIPDVKFTNSTAVNPEVTFEFLPRRAPGKSYYGDAEDSQTLVASTVDSYAEQVFFRARARQMALKVSGSQLGLKWQLGSPRVNARLHGKR
jgi:hypothetical protein